MYFDYLETFTITVIFFSIFVGGIVKGSVGIGMSMFSVPIISFILPPTKAMMFLYLPVVATNLIQMNIINHLNDIKDISKLITKIANYKLRYYFPMLVLINIIIFNFNRKDISLKFLDISKAK